jgi:flagellar hook-basal body complex protein FliE
MNELSIKPTGSSGIDLPSLPDRVKAEQGGPEFSEILGTAIKQVNDLQSKAGEEVRKAMTGEATDIHTTMIAVQKADVSFQMMMQVRNKLVSAYQEIMKMQV